MGKNQPSLICLFKVVCIGTITKYQVLFKWADDLSDIGHERPHDVPKTRKLEAFKTSNQDLVVSCATSATKEFMNDTNM